MVSERFENGGGEARSMLEKYPWRVQEVEAPVAEEIDCGVAADVEAFAFGFEVELAEVAVAVLGLSAAV